MSWMRMVAIKFMRNGQILDKFVMGEQYDGFLDYYFLKH